jgi:protein-S-isoprenylcysteine O-methyltransferase Ste14
MDTLRYAIALTIITAVPAALAYWLLIHPLARFWRRLGPTATYAVVLPAVAGLMATMVALRHRLLALDWGLSPPLAVVGLGLLIASGVLLRRLRRRLTVATLVGLPELSPSPLSGRLITDGVYARIRHPRYVQMTLAILGYALVAGYPAAYAAFLVWCAGIRVVVLLEERELASRFGEEWLAYCRRVPRFIPRARNSQ